MRGRRRHLLPVSLGGGGVLFEQGGAMNLPWHHGAGPSAGTLLLVGLVVCVPVATALLGVLVAGWTRAILRRRRADVRAIRAATGLESRARALMSELCPWGWRAQIALFGNDDELPEEAPAGDRGHVAIDWSELDPLGQVAISRRVWGATIADALEAMVADRRTDETLEQIERAAQLGENL